MGKLLADDRISAAGRAAHDLGAAALFGGNLFARVGMHPALRRISEPRERGMVVNRAWQRYGAVNSAGLVAVIAGWAIARRDEASDSMLTSRERELARAKDVAALAVAATGVASATCGVWFARQEPGGGVALTDGDSPAPGIPAAEARGKRALNLLGAANLAASGALVAINAALAQAGFRRPAVRRLLRRTY